MDNRVWEANASQTPPSVPSNPSIGYPTDGNPGTNTPATTPGDYWFYQVSEEIRNVIIAASLTPDRNTLNQLTQAIQALIQAELPTIQNMINTAVASALAAYKPPTPAPTPAPTPSPTPAPSPAPTPSPTPAPTPAPTPTPTPPPPPPPPPTGG